MATPYSDVYSYFLPKLSDYSFFSLSKEELDANLETWLMTAIVKFKKCKKDLSKRDSLNKEFVEDLSDEEKNILAQLMIVDYLTPKLITAELLQQTLSTKDFKLYSQANHIKEIKSLRDSMKHEANQMVTSYTYTETRMSDFK